LIIEIDKLIIPISNFNYKHLRIAFIKNSSSFKPHYRGSEGLVR